jgi:hypothetical protein
MSQNKSQVDMLLTKVSNGYFPDGYVSEQVLPLVQSAQYSGLLGSYGTQHLRIVNSLKVGRGKYRQVEAVTYSTAGYTIEGHGLEDVVSKEDYRNVLDPFKAEEDKVIGLTNMLWLEKEKLLADTLGSTSVMSQNTTLSGAAQWNEHTTSDPLADVIAAQAAIKAGCGDVANKAVLSWEVWNQLRFHPGMLDALGYKQNRPGGLRVEELAAVFDLDKIFIGKVAYESAVEGQTSSLAPVWGKNFILFRAPDSAKVRELSLGYRVQIEGSTPRKVYKYDLNNPPGAKSVLVEDEYDMLISNAKCGYLIKNAVA